MPRALAKHAVSVRSNPEKNSDGVPSSSQRCAVGMEGQPEEVFGKCVQIDSKLDIVTTLRAEFSKSTKSNGAYNAAEGDVRRIKLEVLS